MKETLSEIKEDNKGLIKRVDVLENNDCKKSEEIIAMKKRMAQMEDTMDNYEQYSKLDNLIVTGLKVLRPYNATALLVNENNEPETDEDGKEQWSARDKDIMLDNFVQFANEKLEVNIRRQDILDIHTLPKGKNTTDTCIVRFANRIAREKVIRSKNKLKSTSRTSNKIYINEHLTRKNSEIARAARLLRKDGKILGTWTKNCKILIKKLDERVIKVHNMAALEHALENPTE